MMASQKEYTVRGVKFDDKSGWPIVILQEVENGRCFGIAISSLNVYPVLVATEPQKWPDCGGRPVTHDFALALARAGGAQIERLVIDNLTERGVFTASLEVRSSGGEIARLDVRPSDAIPVALAAGARVFVADDVAAQLTFYPLTELPYRDITPTDVPGLSR
jgi:bifunctional DNase/RNase